MNAVTTRRQNANTPRSARNANARLSTRCANAPRSARSANTSRSTRGANTPRSTRSANAPRHRAATEGGGVLRVLEMPRFPALPRIGAEREAPK